LYLYKYVKGKVNIFNVFTTVVSIKLPSLFYAFDRLATHPVINFLKPEVIVVESPNVLAPCIPLLRLSNPCREAKFFSSSIKVSPEESKTSFKLSCDEEVSASVNCVQDFDLTEITLTPRLLDDLKNTLLICILNYK